MVRRFVCHKYPEGSIMDPNWTEWLELDCRGNWITSIVFTKDRVEITHSRVLGPPLFSYPNLDITEDQFDAIVKLGTPRRPL